MDGPSPPPTLAPIDPNLTTPSEIGLDSAFDRAFSGITSREFASIAFARDPPNPLLSIGLPLSSRDAVSIEAAFDKYRDGVWSLDKDGFSLLNESGWNEWLAKIADEVIIQKLGLDKNTWALQLADLMLVKEGGSFMTE